jgi:hypothetical protein
VSPEDFPPLQVLQLLFSADRTSAMYQVHPTQPNSLRQPLDLVVFALNDELNNASRGFNDTLVA